jgi:hypothetical protein
LCIIAYIKSELRSLNITLLDGEKHFLESQDLHTIAHKFNPNTAIGGDPVGAALVVARHGDS